MDDGADPGKAVEAWIAAVNAGDTERAGELVTDDVAINGPRGTATGREIVAEWIRHTGIRITARDVRGDGESHCVTVEGDGTWRVEGGAPEERTTSAPISMRLKVLDGRIASIERV
jgi:hypothetical protein